MFAAFFDILTTKHLAGDADVERAGQRLDAIARTLDSAFAIPGTQVRIGADALLNLLPGIGFVLSKGLAAYLIWEARRLGAPGDVLARMRGNLGVDALVSAVPVLGWVGDLFFKANLRNMERLRAHLEDAHPTIDLTARPA